MRDFRPRPAAVHCQETSKPILVNIKVMVGRPERFPFAPCAVCLRSFAASRPGCVARHWLDRRPVSAWSGLLSDNFNVESLPMVLPCACADRTPLLGPAKLPALRPSVWPAPCRLQPPLSPSPPAVASWLALRRRSISRLSAPLRGGSRRGAPGVCPPPPSHGPLPPPPPPHTHCPKAPQNK